MVLIGRLVYDVDLRYTDKHNKPVANFKLSIRRPVHFGGLVYIECKMWGHGAEVLARRAAKGDFVAVSGWIDISYNQANGKKYKNVDVIADSFKLLGANNESE